MASRKSKEEGEDVTVETLHLDPISIPRGAIDFANEIALLAKKYGVRHVTLSTEHNFECGGRSKLEFNISTVDQRIRPCMSVIINLKSEVFLSVLRETPSSD